MERTLWRRGADRSNCWDSVWAFGQYQEALMVKNFQDFYHLV